MYLLALALLFKLPAQDPVVLSVHPTMETCVIALHKAEKAHDDKLQDPDNIAAGMRFVCLRVMEPVI